MQIVLELVNERVEQLLLPSPDQQVLPGIRWGHVQALFTPAYWAAQLWYSNWSGGYTEYAWSGVFRHEVIACLLGGHGITYEMNRAAFTRLKDRGLIDGCDVQIEALETALMEPMRIGKRMMRYRFPRVKSRYIHSALSRLDREDPPMDSAQNLRKWLLGFPGIGVKTASWIARNALKSPEVAVIDIHILRAGVIMGLFSPKDKLPRDYLKLESRFLRFALAIAADPPRLDLIIWWQMRESGPLALISLEQACLIGRRSQTWPASPIARAA